MLLAYRKCTLPLVLLIVMLAGQSLGQPNYLEKLGPPQAGAVVDVELGNINLTNGNLHLEVPVGSPPQRGGLGFSAKLTYDSRIWVPYRAQPAFLPSFRPSNVLGQGLPTIGGWRLVISTWQNGANFSFDNEQCDVQFYPNNAWWATRTGFSWQDPDGVVHSFDPNMMTASMTSAVQGGPTVRPLVTFRIRQGTPWTVPGSIYLAENWNRLRQACTHPSVTLHRSS